MTYKEIINRFRDSASNHKMIVDFGYGELSDIKTQSQLGPEEQGADYPYMFLNTAAHTRNRNVMNYNFNLIMMDMARGEEGDEYDNYISIQSQCQQYIDDVLANLYYFYKDLPEIQFTGITYTPFKEKYQDTLAGMTATITIQVPTPIDNCIAPYEEWELVDTLDIIEGIRSYTSTDSTKNATTIYDIPEGPKELYRVDVDLEFKVLYDISVDPAPYNVPRLVMLQSAGDGLPRIVKEIEFDGTIRTNQTINTSFEVLLGDIPGGSDNSLRPLWGFLGGDSTVPGGAISQPDAIEGIAGTVKIYKLKS